jgi:hypothetical protein
MKNRVWPLKAASLAVVAAAVTASYVSDAHATWYRAHGSACFPIGFNSFNQGQPLWLDNEYTVDNAAGYPSELMCPVPDSSILPRYQFTQVNVETTVNDNNNQANTASLCEDQWNGFGGSCTNFVSTNGGGHQTIFLGGLVGTNGTWTSWSEANFAYVYVDIGPGGGGSNTLRGIFYSN